MREDAAAVIQMRGSMKNLRAVYVVELGLWLLDFDRIVLASL
jgi:hypothetical protein